MEKGNASITANGSEIAKVAISEVHILQFASFVPNQDFVAATFIAIYAGCIIIAGGVVQRAVLKLLFRLRDRLINQVIVVNQVIGYKAFF